MRGPAALNISTPKVGAQAIVAADKLGWKVLHIINNVSASKLLVLEPAGLDKAQGLISTAYFKDPASDEWANDEAMTEFKDALGKYEPRANPEDPNCVYGWAAAQTMVEALKGMEEPTRQALMDSARSLDLEIPILLPGIEVKMDGKEDAYPIEAMQIQRFEGENWKLPLPVGGASGHGIPSVQHGRVPGAPRLVVLAECHQVHRLDGA